MLEEPYRWVEAVRNRREYLEDQLVNASPVVGLHYADGVVLLTTTPGPRKLFEAFNEVAFAAIGHPADIEKLRKAVIDIAHMEAFNHSPRDVTLHRLVNFGIGPLMKGAFDEIFRSPFTARVLVAELDSVEERQSFYTIDADGSFTNWNDAAAVAGTPEAEAAVLERLAEAADRPLDEALGHALEAWAVGRMTAQSEEGAVPGADQVRAYLTEHLDRLPLEAAVLDRTRPTQTKFRLLEAGQLDGVKAAYAG